MTILQNTIPTLPFENELIGLVRTHGGRTFVAWRRQHSHHPFGTHELMASGYCEHGHYMADRDEAFEDLAIRAGYVQAVRS